MQKIVKTRDMQRYIFRGYSDQNPCFDSSGNVVTSFFFNSELVFKWGHSLVHIRTNNIYNAILTGTGADRLTCLRCIQCDYRTAVTLLWGKGKLFSLTLVNMAATPKGVSDLHHSLPGNGFVMQNLCWVTALSPLPHWPLSNALHLPSPCSGMPPSCLRSIYMSAKLSWNGAPSFCHQGGWICPPQADVPPCTSTAYSPEGKNMLYVYVKHTHTLHILLGLCKGLVPAQDTVRIVLIGCNPIHTFPGSKPHWPYVHVSQRKCTPDAGVHRCPLPVVNLSHSQKYLLIIPVSWRWWGLPHFELLTNYWFWKRASWLSVEFWLLYLGWWMWSEFSNNNNNRMNSFFWELHVYYNAILRTTLYNKYYYIHIAAGEVWSRNGIGSWWPPRGFVFVTQNKQIVLYFVQHNKFQMVALRPCRLSGMDTGNNVQQGANSQILCMSTLK